MKRQISIAYPRETAARFQGRTFPSYLAVSRVLKPKEEVLVEVWEVFGKMRVRAGYGPVSGIGADGRYTSPRHLIHEV